MLKDITLGQFFPGNTIVHRLDPRTKLMAVILYIVALFNAKSPLTYAIVAAVLAVCIVASRVPMKSLTRGLKPVYVIVAFTAVMNIFFTGGTAVGEGWLLGHITYEGLTAAIYMVLRIVMLIMGTGPSASPDRPERRWSDRSFRPPAPPASPPAPPTHRNRGS